MDLKDRIDAFLRQANSAPAEVLDESIGEGEGPSDLHFEFDLACGVLEEKTLLDEVTGGHQGEDALIEFIRSHVQ